MTKNTGKIIEVFEENFLTEIKKVSNLLDKYNFVAMDTEFPGIVYQLNSYSNDNYYKTIKMNVDELKLIQIGITLCDKNGNYPIEASTWQFNLKFDVNFEKYSYDSISLLNNSGINFIKLAQLGIPHDTFAEYFLTSGLVLNENIQWISFHGSYDFAYLLKLISGQFLPSNENSFFENLELYFNNFYDIRYMTMNNQNLKGSLNKIAYELEVVRIGSTHQAGSDSIVTSEVFFTLIKNNIINHISINNSRNMLFGFLEGIGDSEMFLLAQNSSKNPTNKINYNNFNNGKNTNKVNNNFTNEVNNLSYYNNAYNVPQYPQKSSVNVSYPYIQNFVSNNYALNVAKMQQLYNINNSSKIVDVNSSGNINNSNTNSGNSMNNNLSRTENKTNYDQGLLEAYST